MGSSINVRFRLRGIKTQISSYLPQNSVGCHLLAAVSNLQKRTTGETRRNRGTRSFGARLDAPWYAAGVTTKRTNSISFPIFILISLFSAYLCIPLEKDWIRWRKKRNAVLATRLADNLLIGPSETNISCAPGRGPSNTNRMASTLRVPEVLYYIFTTVFPGGNG